MNEDAHLTDRELQVLAGCAAGLTKAQIGRWLYLSENTIKTHLRRITQRLGSCSVTDAVSVAARAGLLDNIDVPDPATRPVRVRRDCEQPIPAGVAERFPSTTWGTAEWYCVLIADDHLYHSILRGIGRAVTRREEPSL